MDFYYMPISAPCRAVDMTAQAIGVDLNKKFINLGKGDQLKPEYLKINPQHTVPVLVDGDLTLVESRAILIYLCEQYDSTNKWYPESPQIRAVINQRLYFDMNTLAKSFYDYYYPQLLKKVPADPEMFKKIETAFEWFNTFLSGKKFAAGNNITVADIALLATVTNFDVTLFDFTKYSNVSNWYEACKKIVPGYAENFESTLSLRKHLLKLK